MTYETLLRYLFYFDRDAILAIASDSSAPLTGAVLVLSAAVARNHARHDLLAQPWRLLTPFGASLATGAFLFLFLALRLWLHGTPLPPGAPAAWSLLALYWATAPLAWLYGLPYEWLLGFDRAAKARLWVLGVVSAWRVALIARVLAILLDDNWWAALAIVLLVESALALAALVRVQGSADSLLRPHVSSSLIDAMSGLMVPAGKSGEPPAIDPLLPDPDDLMIEPQPFRPRSLSDRVAFNMIGIGVFGLFIGMLANVAIEPTAAAWTRIANSSAGPLWPATFALGALALWLLICVLTQPAQVRKSRAERLLAGGRAADALAYLASLPRSAFPASWEPPPSEDYRGTPALIQIMEALAQLRPGGWVADSYEPRIRHYVSQPVWYWHYREDAERVCAVLERLPDGRQLAAAALAGLERHEQVLNACRRMFDPAMVSSLPERITSKGPYAISPAPPGCEPDHAELRQRLERLAC